MMSGDVSASVSSRALNAAHQLVEADDPDRIVLEKGTYLIDENNRAIPIPAGTVAVLEHDGKTFDKCESEVNSNATAADDVHTGFGVLTPSATSTESDLQPADSTSLDALSPAAAASTPGGAVSAACEVAEATSTDANPSISLSDMYVQEEEEVTIEDGNKDRNDVVSASVPEPVQESSHPKMKEVGAKPGRKAGQKKSKTRPVPEESQADGDGEEVKRQKGSAFTAPEKPSPAAEKPGNRSASSSPAAAVVSASGRPQRSTPRRSAYEMLHGGESKPQRRLSATELEQESSGGKVKKQKLSKPEVTDEEDQKQGSSDASTSQAKGHRQQSPTQLTSQTSSDGCEGSQLPVSHVCASEVNRPLSPTVSHSAATSSPDIEQSSGSGMTEDAKEVKTDISDTKNEGKISIDGVASVSAKKRGRPKKEVHDSAVTPGMDDDSTKKKAVRKGDAVSKTSKVKGLQKGEKTDDASEMKVPGLPYHYFTKDSSECPDLDNDSDSSSLLADDLAAEGDVDWMTGRIAELEREVQQLRDSSTATQEKKRPSRCWQDVLAEFSGKPSEQSNEEQLLTRYEQKLRIFDRELDDRAAFLRVREGCIARRERRILEKESELGRRERELEHHRHLHGRMKLPVETGAASNPLSSSPTDSSSVATRNIALEKEVRLELRKQELDRQKNALNDERKKLAAKERELENREHALVDADIQSMASGFKSTVAEARSAESDHRNGGTTVEFSDDDDDDNFGCNSFSAFSATAVPLSFSLDRATRDSNDNDHQPETSQLWSSRESDVTGNARGLLDAADEDLTRILRQKAATPSDDEREASEAKVPRLS